MPEPKLIKESLFFVIETNMDDALKQAREQLIKMNEQQAIFFKTWELGPAISYTTPTGKRMTKYELFVRYPGYLEKEVDDVGDVI